MTNTLAPKATINWTYCECGCRGFETCIGGTDFWCFLDSRLRQPKPFYLYLGHGFLGTELGNFRNFAEINRVVIDKIKTDGIIEKLERELKHLRKVIQDDEIDRKRTKQSNNGRSS